MRIDVVTLFPEMITAVLEQGVVSRAVERKIISVHGWNPRDYTTDKHRTVDDKPYGGGPGMLMKVEPLTAAIDAAKAAASVATGQVARVVLMSPQGRSLNHALVQELCAEDALVLVAGRYEGIDERLISARVDDEISLGDFVLSGGEIAAMAVIDAVTRQLPGVLGHADSARLDSHVNGLLEGPQYTRPEQINGSKVPEVLLSGDHEAIRRWRLRQALGRTWERRPDLLGALTLTPEQEKLLAEYVREQS
ncbi:MAG: tRNA (guanine37-N1)-methyltransferase [Halieaceae bacterium]|jgi:tRNA (guanine37-N1)-methyltransferase